MVLRIFLAVLLLLCCSNAWPATAASDPDPYESVNTLLLLIEGVDLESGDRITAWSASDVQIGSGAVEGGRVLVVVRGDDETTPDITEGAQPDEAIYLKVHPSDDETPYPLSIQAIDDVLAGGSPGELRFRNDAFYKLRAAPLSATFALAPNYPNPVTATTTIDYVIPSSAQVRLEVFNTLGQRVATLVNERKPPGEYTVQFNASGLASGLYIYRLRADRRSLSRKMLVVR